MARPRSRALTAFVAFLAVVGLALPTAAPAFAAGELKMVVASASSSYPDGTDDVTFTVTIENAPTACLVADYPFELNYELTGSTPGGLIDDSGVRVGGHVVVGDSLVFEFLVGTVAGPGDYMLYGFTDDPCLGGPSFGESAIIDIEASTEGTLITGTVFEQQVAGSTDPGDYARLEDVVLTLWTADTFEWVTQATTGPDGTFSLLAPINDDYDENTEYVLFAEHYTRWNFGYYYAAGASPATPSSNDFDVATVFTADTGTSYDFYAGRPPGVDATRIDYLCYYGFDAISQDVVTSQVEWEYVCGTDGSIIGAELTYTNDALEGFGYVVFPYALGRVPDRDDINLDYFATINNADDVDITSTSTGVVVRYRDEGATVRNDADDLVQVDVEVELRIDGQWARWTVDVYQAGTSTPATDVPFFFVGALGSEDDTEWEGDSVAAVSWDEGASERPIVGHRQIGGETWHRGDGHGNVAVAAHGDVAYEIVLIDVCPSNVDLGDVLDGVVAAPFGIPFERQGDDCPILPEWTIEPPAFKVGEAFDETFVAPTQAPWDWTQGGYIDAGNLPAGLDFEVIDQREDGVAPSLRLFGTPEEEGPYEFYVYLHDDFGSEVDFAVAGIVDPEGPYVYTGEDTIRGVVHVQTTRGALTAGDYEPQAGVRVVLVSVDYGTWWAEAYTDVDGEFSITAPVESRPDETMRYAVLVDVDGRYFFYDEDADFADPSPQEVDDATVVRPIDFDDAVSYDVYAGRPLGVSDTVASKICRWNGSDWQDVQTATAHWFYVCLTDGSVEYADAAHADSAFDDFGSIVFPSRLDRVPGLWDFRLDYFVSADERTVTDTATGVILNLVDRDVDALNEANELVTVDVEVTLDISGPWARWQVDVYEAGTRIPADDVPFYFAGALGSYDQTIWQRSGTRAVSWDDGDGAPIIGHRVSNDDEWITTDGDHEPTLRAFGDLTYEVALFDWCDGGVGDPLAEAFDALEDAAYGSALPQLGGACVERSTWGFAAPNWQVGVPFDQTFTAPTDGLWDWTDGGRLDAYDLPAGLTFEVLNAGVDGVAPALRIHGTPTTAGAYRVYVELFDEHGHETWFYVSGKVAPLANNPGGGDDDIPIDDPEGGDITLDIDLEVGDLVEGGQVTVTATNLDEGAAFDLTVRSTPQVLTQGTVPTGGAITRTVTLPKLDAGWHSLTFTSTGANGQPAVGRVWFLVSSSGTLLAISTTPPNLGATGASIAGSLLLGTVTLLTGLGLVTLRRRRRDAIA